MRKLLFIAFLFAATLSKGQLQMMFTADSLFGITSPLGVDSLFYWFAADLGVLDSLGGAIATDEGVGTWNDQSGNARHVTQTTNTDRPVYKATGGPGSKPCIQFDGTDDYMLSSSHWWGSDDMTVIAVYKVANATRASIEALISRNTATGNLRQFIVYAGLGGTPYEITVFLAKDGGAANTVDDKDSGKSAAFRAVSWVINGTTTIYIDGSSQSVSRTTAGTGDGTIYNTSNVLGVGVNRASDTPNFFLQGSISEIIVYSKALTTTERAAIENYLNKKYDLYYFLILAFPIAGAKRRKMKNAA